jgi:hypothetical protein
MKNSKRLQRLGNDISRMFFDNMLDNVIVYRDSISDESGISKLAEFIDNDLLMLNAYLSDDYCIMGYSDGGQVFINKDTCKKKSSLEFGTLIHEYVHEWMRLVNPNEPTHGEEFRAKCFEIGRRIKWSTTQIEGNII